MIYTDYEKYFAQLDMAERGELITAIFKYQRDGEEPKQLSPVAYMAFSFMRDQFDRDAEKYRKRLERCRANGALGGRPKKSKETYGFSEKPKKPDNDTETVTDTVTVNDNVNETDTETDAVFYDGIEDDRLRDDDNFLGIELKTGYNPEIQKYFDALKSDRPL